MIPSARLADYTYELPDARVARHPVSPRDSARLLCYRGGALDHRRFYELPSLLPAGAHLVFNDTKVIPARLHFRRDTGARIELFLLEPVAPTTDVGQAMGLPAPATWRCLIGNKKRWKEGETLRYAADFPLTATLEDVADNRVTLRWEPADRPFAELLDATGELPLPPYLRRQATDADRSAYQTVYSRHAGAVAAPTAGLHFTPAVLDALRAYGHTRDFVTLHVSAGTFRPVQTEDAAQHAMHREQIVVSRASVEALQRATGPIVPVGTTSLRTLESLYWYGVLLGAQPDAPLRIPSDLPYRTRTAAQPSRQEALQRVLDHCDRHRLTHLWGETEIYVLPGYQMRLTDALITNFHQPGSTLLLLIAALIGEDWRRVYAEALARDYRFLSYGDSSLLIP